MSIGYASKTLAAPGARMQSVVQRLATPDRLAQAIDGNLRALDAASSRIWPRSGARRGAMASG